MLWTASKPCVPLNDREHNPGEDGGPGCNRNEAHKLGHERPESAEDDAGLANKLSHSFINPQVHHYVLPWLRLCCRNKAENARLKAVDTRNKSGPPADLNKNNRPPRQTDETSDCIIQAASANSLPRAPEKAFEKSRHRKQRDRPRCRSKHSAAPIPSFSTRRSPVRTFARYRGRSRWGPVSYSSPNSAFSGVIGSERT